MIRFSIGLLIRLAATGLPVICLMSAPPAYGHNVSIFAWVESDTVHTESKFSGGKRVRGGKIEAFDHQGRSIHTGTTNDEGYHGFAVPAGAKELKIVLTAGMGHTNHWTIRAEELGAAEVRDSPPIDQGRPEALPSPPAAAAERASTGLDAQAIEAIVERVVERKLAPIRSQLAGQGWTLRDVLAGLGYILGLVGLASYLHHRKQSPGRQAPGRQDR
jgi:nickel transport protein